MVRRNLENLKFWNRKILHIALSTCSAGYGRWFSARSAANFSTSLNDLFKKKARAARKFQDFALCTLHLAHVRPNWLPVPKFSNFALCYSNPGSFPEPFTKSLSRILQTWTLHKRLWDVLYRKIRKRLRKETPTNTLSFRLCMLNDKHIQKGGKLHCRI